MTTGWPPSGRTTANSRHRRPLRQTVQRRPARSISVTSSGLNDFTVLKIEAPRGNPLPTVSARPVSRSRGRRLEPVNCLSSPDGTDPPTRWIKTKSERSCRYVAHPVATDRLPLKLAAGPEQK